MSQFVKDLPIDEIARYYDVGPVDVVKRLGGLQAINWELQTGRGRKVLKRHSEFAAGHVSLIDTFTSIIEAGGISVVASEIARNGARHVWIEDHCYALLPYVEGVVHHANTLRPIDANNCGKLLAKIHSMSSWSPLIGHSRLIRSKPRLDVVPLEDELRSLPVSEARDDAIELLELKGKILDKYGGEWSSKKLVIVHGDFHNENIIFDLQGVAWILDFEYTTIGDPFDDIGQYIDRGVCNIVFDDNSILLAGAFIDGYRTVRKLSVDCG